MILETPHAKLERGDLVRVAGRCPALAIVGKPASADAWGAPTVYLLSGQQVRPQYITRERREFWADRLLREPR